MRALLLFFGLLFALSAVGIDLTALSVLGGAIGVGLGFGLQKIAANYISGFVILAERSLRIGDMVKVDGFEGRITDIRTRYTVIRSLNGREAIVPNETLITTRVENSSLADPRVLVTSAVQVAYGTDVRRLQPLLAAGDRRGAAGRRRPGAVGASRGVLRRRHGPDASTSGSAIRRTARATSGRTSTSRCSTCSTARGSRSRSRSASSMRWCRASPPRRRTAGSRRAIRCRAERARAWRARRAAVVPSNNAGRSRSPFAMSDPEPHDGGCACRAVRYRMLKRPLIVHCCHCSWCQRESGSAFALNALIESDEFVLLSGTLEPVRTPTASGAGQKIMRCPACRVALWSHYAGGGETVSFVRVGTLDEPARLPPDVHIYTTTRPPWVTLPADVPAMPEYYDRKAIFRQESLERMAALHARTTR